MLKALRDLVQACLLSESIRRADVDVMLCLAESDPEALPPRVLALLHEFETQFDRNPAERSEYLLRLSRMLETAHALLRRHSALYLTPRFSMVEQVQARAKDLCEQLRLHVQQLPWLDQRHRRRLLDRIAACELEVMRDLGVLDVIRGGSADLDEVFTALHCEDAQLRALMSELERLARDATFEVAVLDPVTLPPQDLPSLA